MKKPSLSILFFAVFIDLIGFGIVLPLLPMYAKNFGATGLTIGLLMSSYSAMQFIFSSVWGRMSDRVGRRPMLLLGTAGAFVSYLVFAVGSGMTGKTALLVLFASRISGGICGTNVTVAQAYIADITPPEERSKKLGLIGMAFGLGFVCGPGLAWVGLKLFGLSGPGWIAAALCAINFSWAFFRLAESWTPRSEHVQQKPRLKQWIHTLSHPALGLLIGIFFLATFSFTCFETTIGLLVNKNFGVNISDEAGVGKVVLLICYCGFLGAMVQGGATGRMVKRMGEPKMIFVCLVLAAIGMVMMPYLKTWAWLLIGLAIFAIGSSLTRPPVFGLISMFAPATEQGATMGVAQGAGSLARIIGPVFSAGLFYKNVALPYVACAALSFVTALLAVRFLTRPATIEADVAAAAPVVSE